jgi:YD repeat-containing protein
VCVNWDLGSEISSISVSSTVLRSYLLWSTDLFGQINRRFTKEPFGSKSWGEFLGDEMGKIGSKLLIAIALSWIWALVCAPPARAQSWSNGYGARRTITIDHTRVANTDQTNFPILVSGTYSDMATVANGGSVTSSSGYDIIFTSDAAGSSVLAFEQDVYNPSSGAFTYWVKIPTLSHTADTTLYLFYGNSSITTDHSNKTAVWDANYVGVWHLANGTTLSGGDSTSNAYNLTNHNGTLATTGQVDGAASFNGSNNYLSNSALSISAGSSITISFWNYVAAANQSGSAFTIGSSDIPNRIQANAPWSDGTLYWDYGSYSSGGRISQSYSNYLGSWTYVALEFDSSSSKHSIYLNGALTASSTNSNTPQTVQTGIDIGAWPSYYEHGNIDEFRVSTNARSADWVSTEYSNQSAPGTFSIIGSAAPGPSSAAITRLSPSVASWGDSITIQGTNFGAVQGGSLVSFNGITITPQAWSDTSIGVTVPFGAPSGPFSVAVNGVTAISPVLTIRPLPSGWSDGDIGLVGLAGSSSYSHGVFTVQGAGADIYGTADAFHFLHQPLSGDGAIVARVVSFQGGGSYPKAGVMIRETLAAGSTNAYTSHQGAGSSAILFQYRSTTGASTVQSTGSGSLPYWVKVVRSGNSFSGYMSSDGVNWVQVGGTQTITMAQNVDIGLAVASSTTTGLATATFDNVSVSSTAVPGPVITNVSATAGQVGSQVVIYGSGFGISQGSSVVLLNGAATTVNSWSASSITITIPVGATSGSMVVSIAPSMNDSNAVPFTVTGNPIPTGWLDQDVGAVGLAGNATFANGVFTIQGAGADIYGTADAFHFLYQPLSGDGAIVARVVSFQGGGSYPKAGVMIRETLAAGSTNAYTSHQGAGSSAILFQYRSTTGASTVQSTGSGSLPYWVKVVRSGNSFSGYMSSDGVNWVQVGGTQTITMAQNVDIGLAVASSTTTGLATATFDNASLQDSSISGGLVGTITRASDGTLVSGAQVRALQGGMVRTTVNSGSDGRYVFTALTAGLYDISTSASGLGTALNASVSIPAGVISRLDMSLTSPGTIQGRVTQSNGTTAISGATVLASAGQSSVGQTATDSNGNYSLGGLGAATYQVQASAGNYVPATQSAPVTAGSSTTKNFSLQASTAVPITYVYDVLGRLVAAINPSGDTAIYSYDAVGNLLKISRQNSVQLSIISTNPIRGSVGSTVTIFGTGFSATPSQNTVQFNGVTATVQSASATQLMVTIPSSATTGPITVTTSAGTVTSSSSFTIQ